MSWKKNLTREVKQMKKWSNGLRLWSCCDSKGAAAQDRIHKMLLYIYHMIPSIIYLVKTAATLLKTSGQWVRFLVPENDNNTSGKDSAIVTGYVKSIGCAKVTGFAKVTRCAKDAVFQSYRVCQSYRVFQSCRVCLRSKWSKGMGCVKGIIRQWYLQCIYFFALL